MPSSKRIFGDIGEKIAASHLEKKGYTIIERNYKKPWGEIDLVTKKEDKIVFVEVKTRDFYNISHYLAEYSVNHLKRKKLQKLSEVYLAENRYPLNQKWQIDVIAISIDKEAKMGRIKHIENAVWEQQY